MKNGILLEFALFFKCYHNEYSKELLQVTSTSLQRSFQYSLSVKTTNFIVDGNSDQFLNTAF